MILSFRASTTVIKDLPTRNKKVLSRNPYKDKLLQQAPVVPYGADLEHWENPDKMEAPLVIK